MDARTHWQAASRRLTTMDGYLEGTQRGTYAAGKFPKATRAVVYATTFSESVI